jgi:O-antigen ligase
MPLYLSFSRGAWGGLLLGGAVVLAIISWRTMAITFGVAVISLMMAITVPRMVLYDAPPPPAVDVAPDPQPPRQPSLIDSTIARISEIWAGRDLRTLFVANGAPIVVDHPILGVGPGRYGGAAADIFGTPIYAEYGTDALFLDPQQRTVDNFWLHTLVETGVLGFVAYAAAGLAALVPLVRAARKLTGWNRFLVGGIAAGTAAMAANAVTTMLLEANSVAFVVWFLLGLGSLALGSLGLTRDPATPAVATAEESAPSSSS